MKKILAALGLGAIIVFGGVQLATNAQADQPPPKCIGILCAICPDGYVPAPTPGNCCRCVKAH
jgi:hypothetical protein